MKKFLSISLVLIILVSSLCIVVACNNDNNELSISLLEREDWDPFVKENINSLIKTYNNADNYVVFDFDNTSCIFDIEEQLSIYQLETMSFAIKPTDLKAILLTDLSTEDTTVSGYGYFKDDTKDITYNDLTDDIVAAYTKLVETYGQFTATGLSKDKQTQLQSNDDYLEFSTKMRMMYDLVYTKESSSVAYPWILYWFTGMTQDEVYNLAYKSHEKYSKVQTETVTWTTPDDYTSKTGKVTFSWTKGITVTENIKELYRVFAQNGIDVWICSASSIDVVKAAVDCFGLHDYVKGVLAMTNKVVNSKITNKYDYTNGCGYYAKANGSWEKMSVAEGSQTQGEGKVTAINNTIFKEYNKGPIAGFMDSTGDFNFCTEYDSLKLVVCFNRANRKVTDGGGLIAELAVYQKDTLDYDLASANSNGDTLYVLQGRDENNNRTLRTSSYSMLLGATEEKLFKNSDNESMLEYFKTNRLSTSTILNTYSIKTTQSESTFGFKYGFLDSYSGYHSIKNA